MIGPLISYNAGLPTMDLLRGLLQGVIYLKIKVCFIIAFVFLIMAASIAVADSVTVDDGGGADHTTIGEAVNNANPHDTIIIYPGAYIENVDVNKSLNIISQSGNPDDTIVLTANPKDHVFDVAADNVTIRGFTVKGSNYISGYGIYLNGTHNNSISNNKLLDHWFGIKVWSSNNNILRNNSITNSNNNHIGINMGSSNGNKLIDNTVLNYHYGITMSFSNNNTLINNNLSYSNSDGIATYDCQYNMLINNTLDSNADSGIHFRNSSNNMVTGNIICNTTKYGGICFFDGSYNNVIYRNHFKNNKKDVLTFRKNKYTFNIFYDTFSDHWDPFSKATPDEYDFTSRLIFLLNPRK